MKSLVFRIGKSYYKPGSGVDPCFSPVLRETWRRIILTWSSILSYHHPFMISTIWICFAAWFVPGAGHMLLKKWRRGVVFLTALMVLFICGLLMEGRLFGMTPGFFGFLKLVADAGAGLPYILAKLMGWGEGDVTSYAYEYGNTFLFTAGLLNLLLVVDAFDISQGRKR